MSEESQAKQASGDVLRTRLHGIELLLNSRLNKGTAFSEEERDAFGKFIYGLQRFASLQVYTSSGAGTWGPPMRVGTHPEIALLTFEPA